MHVNALTRKVPNQCMAVENDDPAKIAEHAQNQIAPTAMRTGITSMVSGGFGDGFGDIISAISAANGETDEETDGETDEETDGETDGETSWGSVLEELDGETIGEIDILTEMFDRDD